MQKTVLLVEDDAGDRNMYGNILWYNGYHVIAAEDGEAGLRLAQEEHPDLILLDLQLPLLHGMELNSQLKQDDDTKNIPVIALTGRRLDEFGGNADVLGYERFLEKPVSPLQVLREVEALIGLPHVDQAASRERPQVFRTHVPAADSPADHPAPDDAFPSEAVMQIGEHLRANADVVLARWNDLVKEEPWFSLPREHRLSNLTAVVEALIDNLMHEPGAGESIRNAVNAGAAHGSNRRKQGIPETLIPIEFHLLRQAIWRYVNDTLSPSDATYNAILRIDRAITMTLNAAMWGYYREEIEAHEGWDAALEKLVDAADSAGRRAVS